MTYFGEVWNHWHYNRPQIEFIFGPSRDWNIVDQPYRMLRINYIFVEPIHINVNCVFEEC